MSASGPVKLVAIAKDEAAFMAEWVFHHLYFGFDAIDVYVNRTTDNTVDILQHIHRRYPQVRCLSGDWVDLVNHLYVSNELQKIVYAWAYSEASLDRSATYMLFLDIDEFWMPLDYRSTIHDCLRELAFPDMCSFEWLNLVPDREDNEELLLCGKIAGDTDILVKTILKTGLKMKTMRIHYPSCENVRSCLADGSKYVPGKQYIEHLPGPSAELKKYFIVHNMIKSPLKYLASLLRNNPDFLYKNKVSFIKTNRAGSFVKERPARHHLKPPEDFSTEYAPRYIRFFRECELAVPYREAQRHLLTNALNAIQYVKNNLGNEVVQKAVVGLDLDVLRREATTRLFRMHD